jgi:thiol-disulfide isomerase/thioredoxin
LAGTGRKAVHVASVNKQSWVLLNFWGSWCSGRLLEMPDVRQIAHDHADKLIVLGITVTDKEEAVQRFLKRSPLPYPVVHGPSWKSDLLQTYGVSNAHGYHAPVSVLIRPGRRSRLCAGWCKRKTSIPERGNQRSPPASTLATRERQAEIPVWLPGSQRVTGCT